MKVFDSYDLDELFDSYEISENGIALVNHHVIKVDVIEKANQKIVETGSLVYGVQREGKWYFEGDRVHYHTHEAIIVGLTEIVNCKHPIDQVSAIGINKQHYIYKCKCGAEVEPKEFVEVKT